MTIYDHPITNPREYRGEPAKCPLWVFLLSVAVLLGWLAIRPEERHDGPTAAERTARR